MGLTQAVYITIKSSLAECGIHAWTPWLSKNNLLTYFEMHGMVFNIVYCIEQPKPSPFNFSSGPSQQRGNPNTRSPLQISHTADECQHFQSFQSFI